MVPILQASLNPSTILFLKSLTEEFPVRLDSRLRDKARLSDQCRKLTRGSNKLVYGPVIAHSSVGIIIIDCLLRHRGFMKWQSLNLMHL